MEASGGEVGGEGRVWIRPVMRARRSDPLSTIRLLLASLLPLAVAICLRLVLSPVNLINVISVNRPQHTTGRRAIAYLGIKLTLLILSVKYYVCVRYIF